MQANLIMEFYMNSCALYVQDRIQFQGLHHKYAESEISFDRFNSIVVKFHRTNI